MVPLPDTAIDFSDLRSSSSSGSSHKSSRNNEDWTVCNRCETYRPPRAHHCRVCHRCVRRMDHHCPWINNCVGELNQKYFIQFLFYTGLASLYAMGLVLTTWLWPLDSTGAEESVSGHPLRAAQPVSPLLVESVLALGLPYNNGHILPNSAGFHQSQTETLSDRKQLQESHLRKGAVIEEGAATITEAQDRPSCVEVFGRSFMTICWFLPHAICSFPTSASRTLLQPYSPNYFMCDLVASPPGSKQAFPHCSYHLLLLQRAKALVSFSCPLL
uniref:Uncharacterized protein n=1 Tax=Sphaerodactylus townsendi TaxID=933632 RepID=A0ACB8G7Z5_9SAUR